MTLRLQLLGSPHINRDGRPVEVPGYRPLALLAYLLVTGRAHSREHLADLLFDGPDDPRGALRWTLSKLRKAVGRRFIKANRQEIAFNFESDYWLDISAFEAGELELYRGDFLEGLYLRDAPRFEEWLFFERERLRSDYQTGLEARLAAAEAQEETAVAVATAQQLLQMDNLREAWHRALMRAYARQGKRETALAQFEQCRRTLRAELDTDPAPETAALAETIQRGDLEPEISSPDRKTPPHDLTPTPTEPIVEPVESPQPRPRFGLSQPVLATIGAISLVAVFFLILSGVLDGQSRATDDQEGQSAGIVPPSQPTASASEFAATKVTIVGSFYEDMTKLFEQSMVPFETRSGIDIVYLSAFNEAETFIAAQLEQESRPDIVQLPQPGFLADLAAQGKIKPVSTFLAGDYLRQQYPPTFLEMVTLEGEVLGVWHMVMLKSLVWYSPQAFESKGYEVPETWAEMMALSDQIVADGGTPWCIGIESGADTGWVGTDWVEDILLRTAPPETYDAWIRHDLPFNSPEIRRTFDIMGQIWLNEAYVYGGVATIATENVADSPKHLFEEPPGCYLHRQFSFTPHEFPPTATYGQDYDFFLLPPIDPEFGHPVLGGGDIFAMVNDRPEVRAVMRYLTTAESTKAFLKNGGFLAPHRDTPLEWYPTPMDLRLAQIILSADTYRFDGSDMMPGAVGTGSFWRGITAWVEGAELETVLQEIDDSWPE